LETRIEEAHSQVKLQWARLEGDIAKYKEHVGVAVGGHIDEQIHQKLIQYEDVANSFKAFFDRDTLTQVLDGKADMDLIKLLQEQKADQQLVKLLEARLQDQNNKLK
jgi:hypothetical protein